MSQDRPRESVPKRGKLLGLAVALLAVGCGVRPDARAPETVHGEPEGVVGRPGEPAAPGPGGGVAPAPPESPARAETARAETASPGAPALGAGDSGAGGPADPAPGGASEPPPLPQGTTLLHIGDSFAGALGIELNTLLKEQGVRGVLKYQTATYIPTWASSKDLESHLSRYRPDLVMISLGANELEIPDPPARAPTIQRLVRKLGGRPCVWVLPPLWKDARPALLQVIRDNAAPCAVLDSGALVPDLPRMRDRIHPSMDARKVWAAAVVRWLRERRVPDAPGRPFEVR
jgi:lysophospholipase L1-like esterase